VEFELSEDLLKLDREALGTGRDASFRLQQKKIHVDISRTEPN